MKISADMGHGYAKFYNGVDFVKVDSVLGETHGDLINAGGRMEIETKDGRWYVGKTALEQSRNQIMGRSETWAFEPEYRALLLFGISEYASPNTDRIVVDLASGLPITDYRRNREDLIKILKGDHMVKRPGKRELLVEIRNVLFLPQGFAPAKPYLSRDRTIATLDLGSRNIGYATFAGSTLLDNQTNSEEIGATTILIDIGRQIEKETKRELSIPEVVEAIQSKTVRAFNKSHDVSDIVNTRLSYYLRSIDTLMSRVWGNAAHVDSFVLFGGGSLLAGEAIRDRFPDQAVLLDNPQFATAISQWDYANRKFK